MRNKIEKTHTKEKIITRTRQYLCDSAICLRPQSCRDFTIIRERYKVRQYSFSLSQKLHKENSNHQNNGFYILRKEFTMDYKTGQKNWLQIKKPAYFTIQLIFDTIHGSYCTISSNFYIYLQYFQQKIFSFSNISGSQIDP